MYDRCWFPCVDHASVLISYDVTVRVTSPKITAAFNGRLIETADLHDTLEEVGHDGANVIHRGHNNANGNGVWNTAEGKTRYSREPSIVRACAKRFNPHCGGHPHYLDPALCTNLGGVTVVPSEFSPSP